MAGTEYTTREAEELVAAVSEEAPAPRPKENKENGECPLLARHT